MEGNWLSGGLVKKKKNTLAKFYVIANAMMGLGKESF